MQDAALVSGGEEERSWDHGRSGLGGRRPSASTPRQSNGPPRIIGEESFLGEPLKSLSTPRSMSRGVFDLFPVPSRLGIVLPMSIAVLS